MVIPTSVPKYLSKVEQNITNENIEKGNIVEICYSLKLKKTEIHSTSGNDEFDQKARNSIEMANPFPAPPPEIARELERGILALGFPL